MSKQLESRISAGSQPTLSEAEEFTLADLGWGILVWTLRLGIPLIPGVMVGAFLGKLAGNQDVGVMVGATISEITGQAAIEFYLRRQPKGRQPIIN